MDSSLGRDAADAAADAAAGGRGGRGVDAMICLDVVVLWIETADPDLPSLVQFLR